MLRYDNDHRLNSSGASSRANIVEFINTVDLALNMRFPFFYLCVFNAGNRREDSGDEGTALLIFFGVFTAGRLLDQKSVFEAVSTVMG